MSGTTYVNSFWFDFFFRFCISCRVHDAGSECHVCVLCCVCRRGCLVWSYVWRFGIAKKLKNAAGRCGRMIKTPLDGSVVCCASYGEVAVSFTSLGASFSPFSLLCVVGRVHCMHYSFQSFSSSVSRFPDREARFPRGLRLWRSLMFYYMWTVSRNE